MLIREALQAVNPPLTYAITETMNMNANGTTPLKTTGIT